jgi:hypothetical protein
LHCTGKHMLVTFQQIVESNMCVTFSEKLPRFANQRMIEHNMPWWAFLTT